MSLFALLLLLDPPAVRLALPHIDIAAPTNAVVEVRVAGGADADVAARPPIPGKVAPHGTGVRFTPRFPLTAGLTYRVTVMSPHAKPVVADVTVPAAEPGPPPVLAKVYPSADAVPENLLRVYLQFTAPMSRDDVYRHITLERAEGSTVPFPFLDLDQGLWTPDGTRFTLLFDPGRVKQELKPREDLGPALVAGRTFTLAVSRDWSDATGQKLVAGVRKTLKVLPADGEPVDPSAWAVLPPKAGTRDPLLIRLAKPLDFALLHRMVGVADASGKVVPTTASVGGGERVVSLVPDQLWRAGNYALVVNTWLEDPCGNRVGRPFEVDVFRPVTATLERETVSRPFVVK